MFQERLEHYRTLEEQQGSRVLVFVTGDRPNFETQISSETQDIFVNHLDTFNLPDKISLFLYTRGGDTMATWSLINLIKQFCKEYEVIVPSKARSAGTLICLGSQKIIMTKQATLGPIDPSLNSHLNPQDPTVPQNPKVRLPVSVESIKGYFEYAKQELKISNENDLTKIFHTLSTMIHPIVIGNVFRSRSQIKMLANKLLSNNQLDKKTIKNITAFLCSDSGSHDYPIYRREARELGLQIETPNAEFYSLIKSIYDDIHDELLLTTRFDPNVELGNNPTKNYVARRVLIESTTGGTDVFMSEGTLTRQKLTIQPNPGMPPVQQIVTQDQRRFEGWKHEN